MSTFDTTWWGKSCSATLICKLLPWKSGGAGVSPLPTEVSILDGSGLEDKTLREKTSVLPSENGENVFAKLYLQAWSMKERLTSPQGIHGFIQSEWPGNNAQSILCAREDSIHLQIVQACLFPSLIFSSPSFSFSLSLSGIYSPMFEILPSNVIFFSRTDLVPRSRHCDGFV